MASGNGRRADAWTWDEALCGVVPRLISPLDSTGQPDAAAMDALVTHVLEAGCPGRLGLGGSGEGAWLAPPLVALAEDGRARLSALVRRHAGLLAR
jgi:hypothetical protein